MRATKMRLTALALFASAVIMGGSTAQAAPQLLPSLADFALTQSVLARSRPDYDALGIKAGGFDVYPLLQTSFSYNDNIYNSDILKRADEAFTLQPDITARSHWTRHALVLDAGATLTRFVDTPSENSDQYHVTADSRLDVTHAITAALGGGYQRLVEARGSFGDVIVGGEPTRFDTYNAHGSTTVEVSRFLVTPGLSYIAYSYLNVFDGDAVISQSYRDHHEVDASMRIDYSVSPGLRLFGTGVYNTQLYTHHVDGLSQNSHGFTALAGVTFGLSELMSGEFGVGYLEENYVDPRLSNVDGFSYEGKLTWNPTPLLTVTLGASKTLQQSPFVNQTGILVDNVGLTLDYELLRNLILSASGGFESDDYRGIDRHDRLYTEQVRARYLVNRMLEAGLVLDHRQQTTSGTVGRQYAGTSVSLTASLKR